MTSEPLKIGQAGPFEVLVECRYGCRPSPYQHNDFCEGLATRTLRGKYVCDLCAAWSYLTGLLWEEGQYTAVGGSSLRTIIKNAMKRIGKERVTKIGFGHVWDEYFPPIQMSEMEHRIKRGDLTYER